MYGLKRTEREADHFNQRSHLQSALQPLAGFGLLMNVV